MYGNPPESFIFLHLNLVSSRMNTARFFEISRIIGLSAGIFFAYLIGNGDPVTTLHYLSFLVITVLSGLTGTEGIFFGKASAVSMGREADTRYQKQSGGANLAFAITAILVFIVDWGKIADATILITMLLFYIFSATFHTWEIFAMQNRNVKNLLRPLMTLALLAACAWPLMKSLDWM